MKDIEGCRFGQLIAVRPTDKRDKTGGVIWECVCDCGKDCLKEGRNLRNGHTRSCGCYGRKQLTYSGKNKLLKGSAAQKQVFNSYRIRAQKRNIVFSLTEREAYRLFSSSCHYCGQSPSQVSRPRGTYGEYLYNGIDRKDNTQGYVLSNSLPCCGVCNRAKLNLSYDDFIKWIQKIKENII